MEGLHKLLMAVHASVGVGILSMRWTSGILWPASYLASQAAMRLHSLICCLA
jgi:hypothetical protein